ncbi:MAG TPA: hypothetical protein VF310_09790, partial [Vicinamibacteria bacterium]
EIQYFLEELVNYPPVVGVLCVYLGEAIAEEAVMRQDGPGIDPLSKQLFMEHHKEEARHLAFGRAISESFFEGAGPEAKGKIGFLVRSFMSSLVPEFTYSQEISDHLTFDIGIDPKDTEAIRKVRLSPNNQRLNQERWGALLAWIKRQGLAPAEYDWFDPVPPRPAQSAA